MTDSLTIEALKQKHSEMLQERERLRDAFATRDHELARRIDAYEIVMADFPVIAPLHDHRPNPTAVSVTPTPIPHPTKYQGLKLREIIETFADEHGEPVRVADVGAELVAVGFYPDKRSARNSIYTTFDFMAEKGKGRGWERIAPGTYRRVVNRETTISPNDKKELSRFAPLRLSEETGRIENADIGRPSGA